MHTSRRSMHPLRLAKKKRKHLACVCDPDWIRTNDLLLRRQLLYPAELPDRLLKAQIYSN